MLDRLVQPGGSTGLKVQNQVNAQLYGVDESNIIKAEVGVVIPSGTESVLFHEESNQFFDLGGLTGTITTVTLSSQNVLQVVTDNGAYALNKYLNLRDLNEEMDSISEIGNAKVTDLLSSNILSYMTKEDQLLIKSTVGVEVNVDYALKAAIDAGEKYLVYPPVVGVYVHAGTVTIPMGFCIYGSCYRPYTTPSNSSFDNTGTVIRLGTGASYLFAFTGRHNFVGINFDGRDKSVNLMQGSGQLNGCRFERCGIYRWAVGLGKSNYVGTLYARGCNIQGCNLGANNLIDSRLVDTTFNANTGRAISLLTGANNNAFVGVRIEWNDGEGIYLYQSVGNTYTGELIDRNGKAGLAVMGGSSITCSTCSIQRNGSKGTAGTTEQCNILQSDDSVLVLTGIRTTRGVNDDGTGTATPEYDIITTGNGSSMVTVVTGSYFSGGYLGFVKETAIAASKTYFGNHGISNACTVGVFQIRNGRVSIGSPVNITLNAGGTASFSFTRTALTKYQIPNVYNLNIESRDGSAGNLEYLRVPLLMGWETTNPTLITDLGNLKTYPTNRWGDSSSTPTGVSFTVGISTDGTTITVNLTGIDAKNRQVYAYLS